MTKTVELRILALLLTARPARLRPTRRQTAALVYSSQRGCATVELIRACAVTQLSRARSHPAARAQVPVGLTSNRRL